MASTDPRRLVPLSLLAAGLLPMTEAPGGTFPPHTGPRAAAQDGEAPPREFGAVRWGRRIEPALARSARDGKPVLLLFQEVPG